jgi:CRP/FNR family transcriptional regulator, cyclic AMP receptor protein
MGRKHDPTAVLTSRPMADGRLPGLSTDAIRQLADLHTALDFPSGAVLFQESAPAKGILLLCSGSVKISVGSSRGDHLLLRSAGPGEILGLSATLTGQGHEVTAETTAPSRLVFVRRKDFCVTSRSTARLACKWCSV